MSDDTPAPYDLRTALNVLSRLDAVEQRQRAALAAGYNQSFVQGPLVTRWGVTSTVPDYPTYPSSGNVVGVTLGDYEPSPLYPGATATKTFTAYTPPQYVYATLENGSIPAEGTKVRLTWRNGRWWILQDATAAAATTVCITGRGTGTYGWRDGAGGQTTVPIIGWNGTDSMQVKVFPDFTGPTSNAGGTVFTVVESPSAFSNHSVTIKQNGHYRAMVSGVWGLHTLSLSDAQSYLRAIQHRHGYGAGLNTDYTTPDVPALENFWVNNYLGVYLNYGTMSETSIGTSTSALVSYTVDSVVYINATVIAYIERNGSDVPVDWVWTSGGSNLASVAQCSHRGLQATIERIGDL